MVTDPSIVIIQNRKITPRFSDLEDFLEVLEKNYPHPKNREFWTLVHRLGKEFYALNGHYYSNRSLWSKLISLTSFLPLLVKFQRFLRTNAYDFINDFYGDISEEYQKFLEAQILIVAQAHSKEINFFTAALSLGYTFNETHYVPGGFGRLFDQMTAKMKHVKRNTQIEKIERHSDHFTLHTKNESLKAKKVILNSTIYDSGKLFNDEKIKNYYQKYESLNNHQSSFMLYMTIQSTKKYEHHYQLIQDERYIHSISNAVFVSFSDMTDNMLTPEGHYSVTVSIHTDIRFWEDKKTYKRKKEELQRQMLKSICDILDIDESEIVHQFAATPKSFKRYINRSQLGGNAITMKNFLPRLPSNDTTIEGLYHVGDTVYAAQGWPGVMLGVENLRGLLDV
jgi:phytoene dehydrogenase-like protein